MKTALKIFGIVIVVILAVAIIVPMALKPKIGEIVKREANGMLAASLDFDDLDISLLRHFPHASLELKGLSLVGVDRFENDTLVAADRVSVVVNLMSLFGDSGYEVTKVLLNRPAVHARRLADGAVNWNIMKPAEEETPAAGVSDEGEPSSFRLQVRDLRITDAVLSYDDDSSRMNFSVSPMNLRLRGDMSASQTDLGLHLVLGGLNFTNGGVRLLNNAEAELKGTIAADFDNGRYTLTDNMLRLNAVELGVDGWVETGDDAVAMDIAVNSSKVRFKELLSMIPAFYTRDFKNLTASGTLTLGMWARGELKGDMLPAFGVDLKVADGSFKYDALPESVSGINLDLSVGNNGGTLDNTVVDVSRFTMTMAGNSLQASAHVATPASDLRFKAAAEGRVDLGAIGKVYPLDESTSLSGIITLDVAAEGRMSDIEKQRYESMKASGTLSVEQMTARLGGLPEVQVGRFAATVAPASMELSECSLTVGASDLNARGRLSNYLGYILRGDTLRGSLDVTSKLLDVNELMALMPADESADAEEGAAVETEEPAAGTASVVGVPENLDLSLSVLVSKILFQKMTIDDFIGRMSVRNGTVALDRLAFGAFGGKMSASGSYSTAANPSSPALKLSLDVAGARFDETFRQLDLVQKMVPVFEKIGGDYSMDMTLSTSLKSDMSVDYGSFNASGVISTGHLDVSNVGALDKLAEALGNDKLRNIAADDVRISFTIRDGRVNTSPFDIKMGDIAMTLSGSTGLDQTIDYKARVALPGKVGGGVVSDVTAVIGGTFAAPTITVDVEDVARQAVTNIVNEQVQKLTGSETLNEEIEKQAARLREEAARAGDKLVEEARKQRQNLIDKASGALGKIAAEKSGDALVKAAEKQAANLKAEAEKQIARLTAE